MPNSKSLVNGFFRKYRVLFIILLIVIVFGIIVDSINPYIYGEVIDNITRKNPVDLKSNLFFFFLVSISVQCFTVLEMYLGKIVSMKIENGLKEELYRVIIAMKCMGQEKYMGGELLNRLEFEGSSIIEYYIDLITGSLMIASNFFISLYFLIGLSRKLTIISLFMLPMTYLVNFFFRKKLKAIQVVQRKFSDKYYGFLNESLSSLKGVKALQIESHYERCYGAMLFENFIIMTKTLKLNNLVSFIRDFINNCFNIVILFVSSIIILGGQMTIGNMVSFNTYLIKLFSAISKVMELNVQKQNVAVCLERMEEILCQASDFSEDEDGIVEIEAIKRVQFINVSFGYDVRNVIKNFTLNIPKKGLYTIVGKNGAGKSTLLRLLEKFYPCLNGEIIINGVNIKKIKTSQLRSQISYLAKEPFIINDSVINNLKLGIPRISMEEMIFVSQRVGLHQDIMGFEGGYDTVLGEGGSHLSSGQKQKLGIARILLRKSTLVLLDEVTSDLDGSVEKDICQIIKDLSEEMIILNISHRAELVKASDSVIVIDDGELVALGTPEELQSKCDYYQRLFA